LDPGPGRRFRLQITNKDVKRTSCDTKKLEGIDAFTNYDFNKDVRNLYYR